MNKILFFSRDPGGANTVIPIIKGMMRRYECIVYGKDVALKKYSDEQIKAKDICAEISVITEFSVKKWLSEKKVDAVITGTSLDDYVERYIWKASQELGVKSYAIIDQWMNMAIRFTKYDYKSANVFEKEGIHDFRYLPFRICVMDDIAKNKIVDEGIPEGIVIATGQPHFDTVLRNYKIANAVEKYNDERYNILFASEPIIEDYDSYDKQKKFWGYNQISIFDYLLNCILNLADRCNKYRIIIRPHPRECVDKWRERIKEYDYVEVCMDNLNDTYSLLKTADLICGMSSMLLLEAIISGVTVMSIEIGLCRENPFIMDRIGMLKSILTERDLLSNINSIYEGVEQTLEFNIVKNATRNIIELVKKLDD